MRTEPPSPLASALARLRAPAGRVRRWLAARGTVTRVALLLVGLGDPGGGGLSRLARRPGRAGLGLDLRGPEALGRRRRQDLRGARRRGHPACRRPARPGRRQAVEEAGGPRPAEPRPRSSLLRSTTWTARTTRSITCSKCPSDRERRENFRLERMLKAQIEGLDPSIASATVQIHRVKKRGGLANALRGHAPASTSGPKGTARSAIGSSRGSEVPDQGRARPEARRDHRGRPPRPQLPRRGQPVAQGADADARPRGRVAGQDPRGTPAHPGRGRLGAPGGRAGAPAARPRPRRRSPSRWSGPTARSTSSSPAPPPAASTSRAHPHSRPGPTSGSGSPGASTCWTSSRGRPAGSRRQEDLEPMRLTTEKADPRRRRDPHPQGGAGRRQGRPSIQDDLASTRPLLLPSAPRRIRPWTWMALCRRDLGGEHAGGRRPGPAGDPSPLDPARRGRPGGRASSPTARAAPCPAPPSGSAS